MNVTYNYFKKLNMFSKKVVRNFKVLFNLIVNKNEVKRKYYKSEKNGEILVYYFWKPLNNRQ